MVLRWPRDAIARSQSVSLIAELERTNAELIETIARMAMLHDEESARRRAAEALAETREQVLGVVAHELRNPLNVVVMTAKLLLEVPMDATRQHERLAAICRAGEQMNLLIADLLDSVALRGGHSRLPSSTACSIGSGRRSPIAAALASVSRSRSASSRRTAASCGCAARKDAGAGFSFTLPAAPPLM